MNDLQNTQRTQTVFGVLTVIAIAIVGLAIVKWMPYYDKAFAAAAHHSIGKSILMDTADHPPSASMQAALDYAVAYGKAIWKAMVLGLLLGSAVQALLPLRWLLAVFGRTGFAGAALGGIVSMPTMMCTCCAAPVVAGLRECRATGGSAVAFWLGNTMLNPATLIFTGFVLGWNWTVFRLLFGAILVFGLGWLVNRRFEPIESVAVAGQTPAAIRQASEVSFGRWLQLLGRMSVRLIPEYVVLVLALGAARAWLFPHVGNEIDNSLAWIATFAIAGALFVIPTAGEVPILQAMLALGVGVAPAAALLLTLPPISVPSIAMLWRSFKPRTLAIVAAGVVVVGLVGGLSAPLLLTH